MRNKTKPLRSLPIIFFVITITHIFCMAKMSWAEMPSYQRLYPITINIDAPTAVALDRSGNVYVVEATNNRLLVYSQSGEYQKTLAELKRPISVAVDSNGRILIGNHYDNVNHKGNVEVYDSELQLLFKLGTGDGEFSQPIDIGIDGVGKIYVVDRRGDRVKIYNSDGTFFNSFGSSGNGDGEFHKPTSIAIDEGRGEFIVLDHKLTYRAEEDYGAHEYGGYSEGGYWMDGARVQVFDGNLQYSRSFGEWGMEEGQMSRPQGLEVDEEGKVYVTEALQCIVKVFGGDGTYLGRITDMNKPMRTPLGITSGSSKKFYVAALTSGKLEIYGISLYTDMVVEPLWLSFQGQRGGSAPAVQGVTISNNGADVLNWTASADGSWITLSETSGTAGPSAVSGIDVGVNLEGLAAGGYTGSVSVSAESGATETVEVELTVSEVILIANPGGPYTGVEGQAVMFDGSNSGGVIRLYEWDIDNNGTYDYSSSAATQSHVYTEGHPYTVKMRVTDDVGATDEALAMADISDSLPAAGFTGSPRSGGAPLTVHFSNTSTGYDQPLTYEWDFDSDGTVDSTAESPSHAYSSAGSYTVTLLVTDSDESTDTLTRTGYITVTSEPCSNPPVKIGSSSYTTLQAAYDAAGDGITIKSRAVIFTEDLYINKSVTLEGGYDCDYGVIIGKTTLKGNMTISTGTVVIENFVLE